jgi:hypothetical protein
LSTSHLQWLEAGNPGSVEGYARVGDALGLRLEMDLLDPRRSRGIIRSEDPVHAALGDWLAGRLRPFGYRVMLDEPYQHYQFAGRADLVAWTLEPPRLLHVENRTRFPNIQEAIGSYNAKRAYLPAVLAQRLGLHRGFVSVTNVMAVLWSAEALHDVRLRVSTFDATCPDPLGAFEAWLAGEPSVDGVQSILAIVDPTAQGRRRMIAGLSEFGPIRAHFRGYAEALEAFRAAGLC